MSVIGSMTKTKLSRPIGEAMSDIGDFLHNDDDVEYWARKSRRGRDEESGPPRDEKPEQLKLPWEDGTKQRALAVESAGVRMTAPQMRDRRQAPFAWVVITVLAVLAALGGVTFGLWSHFHGTSTATVQQNINGQSGLDTSNTSPSYKAGWAWPTGAVGSAADMYNEFAQTGSYVRGESVEDEVCNTDWTFAVQLHNAGNLYNRSEWIQGCVDGYRAMFSDGRIIPVK